jgi:hypothetical protein
MYIHCKFFFLKDCTLVVLFFMLINKRYISCSKSYFHLPMVITELPFNKIWKLIFDEFLESGRVEYHAEMSNMSTELNLQSRERVWLVFQLTFLHSENDLLNINKRYISCSKSYFHLLMVINKQSVTSGLLNLHFRSKQSTFLMCQLRSFVKLPSIQPQSIFVIRSTVYNTIE